MRPLTRWFSRDRVVEVTYLYQERAAPSGEMPVHYLLRISDVVNESLLEPVLHALYGLGVLRALREYTHTHDGYYAVLITESLDQAVRKPKSRARFWATRVHTALTAVNTGPPNYLGQQESAELVVGRVQCVCGCSRKGHQNSSEMPCTNCSCKQFRAAAVSH